METMAVRYARSFFEKLRGMMFYKEHPVPLLLCSSRAIHTFGMRFAIDVLFLDRTHTVLAEYRRVPPGRMLIGPYGTVAVLEIQAEKRTDTYTVGHVLTFKTYAG